MATSIQNLTKVYLCNVPIDSTYQNQLDFSSASEQQAYFAGKQVNAQQNLTYQRKDKYIEYPAEVDRLWGVNYVMYQNEDFGTKWFYAFIDKLEYRNPNNTRIYINTDAWQTWQFNINIGRCYVEREHTSVSETISIEEGLDCGNEYVCREQVHLFNNPATTYIAVMKDTITDIMNSKYYDKIPPVRVQQAPESTHYYLFNDNFRQLLKCPIKPEEKIIVENPPNLVNPVSGQTDWWGEVVKMSEVMNTFFFGDGATQGGTGFYPYVSKYEETVNLIKERSARISNSIIEIFRMPFQGSYDFVNEEFGQLSCQRITGVSDNYGIGTPENSGITNNSFSEPKLNYYPYTFYRLTNHKGSSQVFKPEYVASPTVGYNTGFGSPVKIKYYLTNYQGGINAKDKSVISNVNASLSVLNDQYGSYLMNSKTQNDVSIANSAIGGVAQGVVTGALAGGTVGAAVGGLVGAVLPTAQRIAQLNAKKQDIQGMPPTITGNASNGNFDYFDNEDGVWVEKWTINDQHATTLTDYFTRYGYQINRVKVPNFKGRENFNYIKTTDSLISGGVPMEDIETIKTMFNNGVTMWHSPWNVGS